MPRPRPFRVANPLAGRSSSTARSAGRLLPGRGSSPSAPADAACGQRSEPSFASSLVLVNSGLNLRGSECVGCEPFHSAERTGAAPRSHQGYVASCAPGAPPAATGGACAAASSAPPCGGRAQAPGSNDTELSAPPRPR
jgi:hypothetical protein